jgi:hypothetical protein
LELLLLSQYRAAAPPLQRTRARAAILESFIMIPCSEDSIGSELHNLREVRANLIECLDVLPEDAVTHIKMAAALSFVQLAIDALSTFQAGRAVSA